MFQPLPFFPLPLGSHRLQVAAVSDKLLDDFPLRFTVHARLFKADVARAATQEDALLPRIMVNSLPRSDMIQR